MLMTLGLGRQCLKRNRARDLTEHITCCFELLLCVFVMYMSMCSCMHVPSCVVNFRERSNSHELLAETQPVVN